MAAGVVTRRLGRILVVGRQEAVTIHELVGRAGEVEGATLETVRLYEEALEAFFRRDWSGCLGMAGRILSRVADGPSLHLKRLAMHYADNPPPDDWQGEFVRTVKD
jgi:adenylate cyclase